MKVVTKRQTQEHKNSDACVALEYPLGDDDINGAVIKLNGRYPDAGYVMNEVCKELVYIIKGSGKLVTNHEEQKLEPDDLVLLIPGEKYFFEGNLEMFMPCSPAWYPEQHTEVN